MLLGSVAAGLPFVSGYGSVASLIALDITEAGASAIGEIRFAESSAVLPAAAYYPGDPASLIDGAGGDVWLGIDYVGDEAADLRVPHLGGYAWYTILHEIGHALGLKHGHEPDVGFDAVLPYDHDSSEFSVMTYRTSLGGSVKGGYTADSYDYAVTFMVEDIRALQTLYGADYSAEAYNGATVYRWDSDTGEMFLSENGGSFVGQGRRGGDAEATQAGMNRIFMTIWDGGGTDTYDLSNYDTDLRVDLQPGHWSVLSTAQLADLDFLNPGTAIAGGNVYNAYDFGNDGRGLIENAIGGSGNDSITGNATTNLLTGNDGNDSLDGGSGNDTLIGSLGADALYGGAGIDTASYANAAAAVTVIAGLGYAGEAAGDVLLLVENLVGSRFADYLGGNDDSNRIDAGAGDDTVFGFGGNDTILVGADSDVAYGGDGDDEITGSGVGTDMLFGDAGNDSIRGSDDKAAGDVGDYLVGGDGDDVIVGSRVGDTIFGDLFDNAGIAGSGGDYIAGFTGDDLIFGGPGNDTLIGGLGFDVIYGGDGNDLITDVLGTGGDFAGNIFIGSDGDDTIEASAGSDYLVGGTGANLFVFTTGEFGGNDRIADFEVGIDRVGIRPGGFPFSQAILIEDLLANLVTVGTSTVLVLAPDNTVEFVGLAQASLSASDFILV